MAFSSEEEIFIRLILVVCNSASLFGSLSIIVLFLIYKNLRSYAFKLVFYMSISDAIRAIGFILPLHPKSYCIAQSILTTFGSTSGLLWTTIIAICLYCVVIKKITNISKYHKHMLLIGYILPLILTFLPETTNSYGEQFGWCWIKKDSYGILWRICGFYTIMFLVLIINIYCYYKIIKEISNDLVLLAKGPHELSDKHKLFNRFKLYPMIIIICYLPLFIKRLYELIDNNTIFWLTIVSGFSTSIIGLLNAIVYGFTDNVKETILDTFKKNSVARSVSINDL